MAIVLTNGIYYIYLNNKGKHRKTTDIKQVLQYNTVREAIKYMNIAPIKTEGFCVYDTFSNRTLWKRLTQEERIELQEQRNGIVVFHPIHKERWYMLFCIDYPDQVSVF